VRIDTFIQIYVYLCWVYIVSFFVLINTDQHVAKSLIMIICKQFPRVKVKYKQCE